MHVVPRLHTYIVSYSSVLFDFTDERLSIQFVSCDGHESSQGIRAIKIQELFNDRHQEGWIRAGHLLNDVRLCIKRKTVVNRILPYTWKRKSDKQTTQEGLLTHFPQSLLLLYSADRYYIHLISAHMHY